MRRAERESERKTKELKQDTYRRTNALIPKVLLKNIEDNLNFF